MFSPLLVFINIISSLAPCFFNSRNLWKNWWVYPVWAFFPFTQWSHWTYSQYTSSVLARVSFAGVKHKTNRRFEVILRFFLIESLEAPVQKLRQTVLIIWWFLFLFDILRFLTICSRLVIQALSKRHIELIGRNISQHQTCYIPLCIRSLLQALHTSSGYLDSFYTYCTHQHTVFFVVCDKLEVSGRKWLWRNSKWYQRTPEWNRNGWCSPWKFNSWISEYKSSVCAKGSLCSCFDLTPLLSVRKEYFRFFFGFWNYF